MSFPWLTLLEKERNNKKHPKKEKKKENTKNVSLIRIIKFL